MKHATKSDRKSTVIILLGCLLLCPLFAMAKDDTNPLTGMYYGTAYITSPAELGTIDLAFYLDVALNGTAILGETSYIDLEKTLVFPKVGDLVGGREAGPRVTGIHNLTSFHLETPEWFFSRIGDKNVGRRISLTADTIENGGNTLSGTYTETIKDMGPDEDPVVVTGAFMLVKPTVAAPSILKDADSSGCLDLNEVMAAGLDTNAMEYSDVSAALHLHNNPSLSPNICSEAEMAKIIEEYYKTLK